MGEIFLNIALDLPIYKLFTYKVPENLIKEIEIGKRVLVNFSGKILTGFIVGILKDTTLENVKDIKSVLDSGRLIEEEYIEFSNWLSQYYIQPIGEFIFSFDKRENLIKEFNIKRSSSVFRYLFISDVLNLFSICFLVR